MHDPQPTFATLTSQRLTLSCAHWGAREKPTLILVHGGRDQKRSWDPVARKLCQDFHVITYDLRGHGESDWSNDGDYGIMDHVFDLATIADELAGERFSLIGHSLGGNIALRYSGLFPGRIQQLVAIEGMGPSPKLLATRQNQPADARLRDWITERRALSQRTPRRMPNVSEAKTRMGKAFPQLSRQQIDHLTQTGLRTHPDGSVSWAYDPAGMGRSPSDITPDTIRALFAQITCPTLLLYGADSWASNPAIDGRAAVFANASVNLIEQAGHWLHHDQVDAFMSQLDQFLS